MLLLTSPLPTRRALAIGLILATGAQQQGFARSDTVNKHAL
jgi:hypothetical protein